MHMKAFAEEDEGQRMCASPFKACLKHGVNLCLDTA